MKLRIKGNSLRLRVSQVDLARLMKTGLVEDTIQFAPAADARLTYALAVGDETQDLTLSYLDQTATLTLSRDAARHWAESDEVGVYADGAVALIVEKDFACLDSNDPQDVDAFPNPNATGAC